jgi:ABC-type transport system involved in Fe-S cluster assembly fused permease/ATPase subunit
VALAHVGCCCVQVRKVMNALDNERESRATDMLLNYETIKYFCAEEPELSGYDTATRKYQVSTYMHCDITTQVLTVW